MEVSTREVADALNLPTHVIEALEADDHDRLPPTVFTRGYLRSYARLLELDSDRLLASYPEVTGEVDLVTGETAAVTPSLNVSKETIGIAVAVAAVVVLVGLLVWLLAGDDDEAGRAGDPGAVARPEIPLQTGSGADVETIEAPLTGDSSTDVLPAAGTDAENEAETGAKSESETGAEIESATGRELESATGTEIESATTPEVQTPAPVAADPAAAEATRATVQPAAVTAARPTTTTVRSTAIRERRITEFGDDVLTMVFGEDCWVEVKTMDEVNLYSDLNRAGQTLILTGRAPFRLRLGYAPGVTLSFNGEAVPLQRHSRNNVANLVVGE